MSRITVIDSPNGPILMADYENNALTPTPTAEERTKIDQVTLELRAVALENPVDVHLAKAVPETSDRIDDPLSPNLVIDPEFKPGSIVRLRSRT